MPTEQAPQANSTDLTKELEDIILDTIVQALNGVMTNLKRYPPGAAIVKMAVERGMGGFKQVFEKLSSVTFTETDSMLMVDDTIFGEKIQKKAFVESFVKLMQARTIKSISFRRGLSEEELLNFMNIFSESPEVIKKMDNFSEHVEQQGITNVEVDKTVFVKIQKGQTVANISDLERIAHSGGTSASTADVKDGMFLAYLLQKIPVQNLDISDEKFEELKEQVDFERLKDAKDIDFERLGPVLAAGMEKLMDVGEADVGEYQGERSTKGSPRIRVKWEAERDTKVEKLIGTFKNSLNGLYEIPSPELRNKLIADFIRVAANFKTPNLARILCADLEEPKGMDIKSLVISKMTMKKRIEIVDMVTIRMARLLEGLDPLDFYFDVEEIEQAEQAFLRFGPFLKTPDAKPLTERLKKAVPLARLLIKEGQSEESLLILKMRRLIARKPEYYLEEEFLENIQHVAERLLKVKRGDVLKKLLYRVAENLDNNDTDVRKETVNAFVAIQKALFDAGNVSLVNECFGLLIRRLPKETDTQEFAVILAAIVSGFSRFIENKEYTLALNILGNLNKVSAVIKNPKHKEILLEGISRISRNADVNEKLLKDLQEADKKSAEHVVKVILALPLDSILPQILLLLKDSDQMHVRKQCLNVISRFGGGVVDVILQELSREQPWYYIRNLVGLLANVPSDKSVSILANHLKNPDDRVQKSCISALIKVNNREAQRVLADALGGFDDSGKRMVVNYFGQVASPVGAESLMGMLANKTLVETNPSMTVEVITAVGKIGHPDSFDVLSGLIQKGGFLGLFNKRNDEILIAVLRAFARLRDSNGAAIAKKYVRDKNPEVAKAAQMAVNAG